MHSSNYFSGFALKNESPLFDNYISSSPYTIAGFSYGAIKAFEYCLTTTSRVDTLTLLSPAFFLDCEVKFVRTQLIHFKKDKDSYIKNFLKNSAYPSSKDLTQFLSIGVINELKTLLEYKWDKKKLETIIKKNIKIEIYLGSLDKIINSNSAYEYFKDYATIHYLKDKGHILCKQ